MCDGGSCQEHRGIMVNGWPDNMAQVAVLDGNLQKISYHLIRGFFMRYFEWIIINLDYSP